MEVILLPRLLKKRGETSIFLHPLLSICPSGLCSHYQNYNRGMSIELHQCKSEKKEEWSSPSAHSKRTLNLWYASSGISWHDPFRGFCLQLSIHCTTLLVVPCSKTAGYITVPKPSLLTSQYLSLNSWRRQCLHEGCATLCLLPLWLGWGSKAEHEEGPAVEKWQWLQSLPCEWQQWTQGCVKQCATGGMGAPEATQLLEEQDVAWNVSPKGTHFPKWFKWT